MRHFVLGLWLRLEIEGDLLGVQAPADGIPQRGGPGSPGAAIAPLTLALPARAGGLMALCPGVPAIAVTDGQAAELITGAACGLKPRGDGAVRAGDGVEVRTPTDVNGLPRRGVPPNDEPTDGTAKGTGGVIGSGNWREHADPCPLDALNIDPGESKCCDGDAGCPDDGNDVAEESRPNWFMLDDTRALSVDVCPSIDLCDL